MYLEMDWEDDWERDREALEEGLVTVTFDEDLPDRSEERRMIPKKSGLDLCRDSC